MSSHATCLLAIFLSIALPWPLSAQTLPTTTPTTQPSIQCSPEVQTLIPLIREGERLYTDIELSCTLTDRGVGPAPNQSFEHVRTVTWIHSKSRFYSETVQCWDMGRPNASETRTVASWDGQFHRVFMEDLIKNDRAAMISLRPPSTLTPINDNSPFFPFCTNVTRPLADHLIFGASREALGSQQITRLPDADWHSRRCVRIQIVEDTPAADPRPATHTIYTWHLLADAHYLPVKMEALIHHGDQQGVCLAEATDLQELAPGIFHPTEVTQSIGDATNGRVMTWNYDQVALNPDLPADKLANIPIPPGTLLIARNDNKQLARAKTDDHWTLRSAAAFLLDPTTTTQPAR